MIVLLIVKYSALVSLENGDGRDWMLKAFAQKDKQIVAIPKASFPVELNNGKLFS